MCYYSCPRCDCDFEAPCWDSVACPQCDNEYYCSEECFEDYSDCWMNVEWEDYEKWMKNQ